MSTEEIIKNILAQHFVEYKAFHELLLFAFVVIQAGFAYYITKRMERFKAFLKKSEIKFSRYHDLQIESLKINYEKLVYFTSVNHELFDSAYDNNNHKEYKTRINAWLTTHNDCLTQLSIDKILLPEELIKLVDIIVLDFRKVFSILLQENAVLENRKIEFRRDNGVIQEFRDEDLILINDKISKLKTEDFVERSDKNIRSLRVAIEKHFAKMNQ
jgi:hypothetical protein